MSGVPDRWNRFPKDDGWRKVHLASTEALANAPLADVGRVLPCRLP
jgi:hypothetical protein